VKTAQINIDYHVEFDHHYYSVRCVVAGIECASMLGPPAQIFCILIHSKLGGGLELKKTFRFQIASKHPRACSRPT
jgi:hypothetical protein